MHLTVLSWGHKIYAPGVKVTLDLASALVPLGTKVSAVLVDSSPETEAEARRRLGEANVRACQNLSELPGIVRALGSDAVYSKDHIDSLDALAAVKKATRAKTLAFTSGFHALDALRPPPTAETPSKRGSPRLQRLRGFSGATRRYRELLADLDGVVAISYYCEMLEELLYGVRPKGIVYPVVDPAFYSPPASGAVRRGILVYVGPAANRDAEEFTPALRDLPTTAGPIHLFGNADGTQAALDALGADLAVRHVDLSPEELVKLYRGVRWTYITSEWEGFGYVGPESLLCGTPVVAEVAQPWMEVWGESAAVRIARSGDARRALLSAAPSDADLDLGRARERLAGILGPEPVARRFDKVLRSL